MTHDRRTLTVAQTLALSFGSIILMMALIGGTALSKIAGFRDDLDELVDTRAETVAIAGALGAELAAQGIALRDAILAGMTGRLADVDGLLARIEASGGRADALTARLDRALDDDDARSRLAALMTAREAFLKVRAGIVASLRESQFDVAADHVMNKLAPVQVPYTEAVDAMQALQRERMQDTASRGKARSRQAATVIVATGLVALFAAIGITGWIARRLVRQLGGEPDALAAIAQAVADGDLRRPIPLRAGDRRSVTAAFHAMQGRLVAIVAGVRSGAEGIAAGAGQIAAASLDLSRRTDAQASSLEQASAAVEQLAEAMRDSAEAGRRAGGLAAGMATAARDSGERVTGLVTTVTAISESSRRVAEIVGVIDGIAFQTNLLALNAAVEAARAGEQGRGFAVVASEVRALAQRASQASREMRTLDEDSLARTEGVRDRGHEAAQAMRGLLAQVEEVATLIARIGETGEQQARGVAQVSDSVRGLDEGTQRYAALVEDGAESARGLDGQAAALVESVSVFRLP